MVTKRADVPTIPRVMAVTTIAMTAGLSLFVTLDDKRHLFRFVRHVPGGDVTAHFLIMGAVSWAMNWGFSATGTGARARDFVRRTAIFLLAISLEECSQRFFPSRTFSWADLFAGWAGVLIFAYLAFRMRGSRAAGVA